MLIHLIAGLIKNISLYKLSYFPEPYTHSKNKKDATKSDLNSATAIDIFRQFAKKTDFGSLKSDIDKLDIGKLQTTPTDLSKLSNVVRTMLLKRQHMVNWLKTLVLFRLLILVT